uniref:Putative secreted protein n=1 Tax=Amblyomma triste TaxID=251400 RepID=A0A023G5G1_AMBTT
MIKMSGEIVLLLLSVLWAADADKLSGQKGIDQNKHSKATTEKYILGELSLPNEELDLGDKKKLLLESGFIFDLPPLMKTVKSNIIILSGSQNSTDYETMINSTKVNYTVQISGESPKHNLAARFGFTNLTVIIVRSSTGFNITSTTLDLKKVRYKTERTIKASLNRKTPEFRAMVIGDATKVITQKVTNWTLSWNYLEEQINVS